MSAPPVASLPAPLDRRYRVLADRGAGGRLGSGGMGEVIAARDLLLEREVAVKLLRPEKRPAQGRLREEFAVLASLDHPGVVPVHDVGRAGERVYLTTDLLDGERLDRWLARGPDAVAVSGVLADSLATLAWLHGRGVVHGDLKPANVLLVGERTHRPWPVLIDFGLAVSTGAARRLGGTPAWTAPELLADPEAPPGPTADLFALGRSFLPWAEGGGSGPAAEIVRRLGAARPEERPASAAEALRSLGLEGPERHRLGGSGPGTLWRDAAREAALRVASRPGAWHVALPAVEDGHSFLRALRVELGVRGAPAVLLPPAESLAEPLSLWRRLLPCLTDGSLDLLLEAETLGEAAAGDLDAAGTAAGAEVSSAAVGAEIARASDRVEVLSARLVDAIGSAPSPPVVLVSDAERLPAPDRELLRRCLAAGAFERIVLTGAGGLGAPEPLGLEGFEVPAPDRGEVRRVLRAHGVDERAPREAWPVLLAWARAGDAGLRALLQEWAAEGALAPDPAGAWRWQVEVPGTDGEEPWRRRAVAFAADGGASVALDRLRVRLWDGLPEDAKALAGVLRSLGGEARRSELGEAAAASTGLLGRLVAEGWAAWRGPEEVRLREAVLERAGVSPPRPDAGERRRLLEVLRARGPSADGALAVLLDEDGRPAEASEAWRRHARRMDVTMDPGRAGEAWLAAARSAVAADLDDALVLDLAGRAVVSLEEAGRGEGVDHALSLAAEAAERLGTRAARLEFELCRVRAETHRAHPDIVLEAVESGRRLLEGLDRAAPERDRHRFALALGEGTAHAQRGNAAKAAERLEEAADLAEAARDLHAVGRVTNNLGNLLLVAGRYEEAVLAYDRSHAAKRTTGDVRGQRIARSNAALARRALGRLVEAADSASEARELAKRIGDRRGEAASALALAQIRLDLGDLEGAAGEIEAFDRLPVASALVRLDGENVRARLLLGRGDREGALRTAEAARAKAREEGLAAAAREASLLAWFARGETGAEEEAPAALAVLAREAEEAGEERDVPALRASLALALARSGRWGEAREAAGLAARSLAVLSGPGHERALAALGLAAAQVGDERLAGAVATAAEALLAARLEAHAALGGRAGRKSVAVALGIEAWVEAGADEGDEAMARGVQEPGRDGASPGGSVDGTTDRGRTAEEESAAALPGAVGAGAVGEPQAWAEALRTVARARACHLFRLDSTGENLVASGLEAGAGGGAPDAIRSARWQAVARQVRLRSGTFAAKGAGEVVEALGFAFPNTGSTPRAAVVFDFGDGAVEGAAALESGLAFPAALAGLALDRARLEAEAAELRAALARSEESRESLRLRHEDEVSQLQDALQHSRLESELRFGYDRIVHRSRAMNRVLRTLDKVTGHDLPVLLTGESGAGKEVLARALHANGPRRGAPFVAENCGAIPAELFESVFFGHVRGAFTGAHAAKTGLVEAAKGGVLFLDEVGELRPEHQVKLLRVLQERRFRPVGAQREVEADFRLVAATNRDLEAMVKEGRFREDLYYRLAVVTVDVPPLRERPEDVLPLVEHFLARFEEGSGRALRIDTAAADALAGYAWPGNVRELENEMLRASVLAEGDAIQPRHLSPKVRGVVPGSARAAAAPSGPAAATSEPPAPTDREGAATWAGGTLADAMAKVERQVLEAALRETRGRKAETARRLGISRPGLDSKLERHGIDVKAWRAPKRGPRRGDEA